jgi:hypothetical protein
MRGPLASSRCRTNSTDTAIARGFVGVNDPTHCAFYYGAKLWDDSNSGTTWDEPSGGGSNDECTSSTGASAPRHDVDQQWTYHPYDNPNDNLYYLTVNAFVDYTWCDVGGDDYTGGTVGNDLSEDKIRLNSAHFCWQYDNGTTPSSFEGIDFTTSIHNTTLTVDPSTEVMDSKPEPGAHCSSPIDLRNSIHSGNGDGGVWWSLSDGTVRTVDAHVRINLAPDDDWPFLTELPTVPPTYVGQQYVSPGDATALVLNTY